MMGNFLSLGMGSAMLAFAVGMSFRYQEEICRKREGAKIWFLTLAMGAAMLFSGGGSALFLTLQGTLGVVVAGCCLIELHREKVLRERRRRKSRRVSPVSQKNADFVSSSQGTLGLSRCGQEDRRFSGSGNRAA